MSFTKSRPSKSTKKKASSGSHLNSEKSGSSRTAASPNHGIHSPSCGSTTVSSVTELGSVLARTGITQEQLNQECEYRVFSEIAETATDYRTYGSRLGLSSSDITEQERNTHISHSMKLITAAVFEEWHRRMGSKATYYELVLMFLTSKNQNAAEKVCLVLKAKVKG